MSIFSKDLGYFLGFRFYYWKLVQTNLDTLVIGFFGDTATWSCKGVEWHFTNENDGVLKCLGKYSQIIFLSTCEGFILSVDLGGTEWWE